MMGQTSGLEKSVKCTAAIATAFTIGKFGADDDTMSLATGATDGLIGIFQHITANANDSVRVMLTGGISRLKLGGAVTRGDRITSDANGKGVKAVLGNSIIGYALASGVENDIIPALIMPQLFSPNMGVDGLTLKGLAIATYDFAEHGGDVGAIGLGVTLPDNAIVTFGFGDVITGCTSAGGTGTIALKAEGAGDLLAAVDADTLSGQIALVPVGTAATMVKLSEARELTATIAEEALTAGKIIFFCEYVLSA